MQTRRAAFIHSAELERFGYPPDCPFDTSRAARTRDTVASMGLLDAPGRREEAPRAAEPEELQKFHSRRYLDALERASEGDLNADGFAMGLGSLDCPVFIGMYEYTTLAAGASLTGARLLLNDEADVAFNPSGGFHHAHAEAAAGFCYVNDIVLAVLALAGAGKRVLFLDIDVHHCDGVQEAFRHRSDVMTLSLHESGKTLFPGTGFEDDIGVGEGEGFSVNIPLPEGTHDEAYMKAFTEVAWPLARAYDPDAVILELGMDALANDPLAHLQLTNNVHADIVGRVLGLGKPLLATGGGGYNVENTIRGWALCWSVLSGGEVEDLSAGMGGVMMETTEWAGGLRDRAVPPDATRAASITTAIDATIRRLQANLFPLHGIQVSG